MTEFIERAVDFEPLPDEERKDSGGDGRTLEGYAAVFDADTEINSWEGHFKERIVRGAFRKTLKERTPVLQFDHGHDSRFGSLPIGNFENIREDKHGLRVQARLFDHAEPIREAIASGAVSGMSFRFKVVRDSWADNKGNEIKDRNELVELLYGGDKKRGPLQRTIKEVKLMEAGPVVFPAYPQTTVGVRSMSDDDRKRAIEELTAGFEASDEEILDELARQEAEEDDERAGKKKPPPFAAKKKGDNADDTDDEDDGDDDEDEDGNKKPKKKKTSSAGGSSAKTEKKSEDGTSSAPEVGDDAAEPRSEDPNDAAQAGTSTGMTKNARERALSLLDLI